MPFFKTPHAEIHYEIVEGLLPEDTFFIHGNLASHRWWYPAEAIWRKKAKGEQKGAMIRVDFLGCGKSSAPRSQEDVDMKAFARDFTDLVKSLGRGPMHVVGHSTGGLIAALMLAEEPTLFKKAVLLDPVGARGVTFDESITSAFEKMKNDRALVALVIGSTIKDNNPEADFFRQVIVDDAAHSIQSVGDKVLRALDGFDVRPTVAEIGNPVLVLHGEHDSLLPVQDSRELASLMKHAQFSIIPGQGHCTNVENPEKFVAHVHDFLFVN